MHKNLRNLDRKEKLVIIGANQYQLPLIVKASELGFETHVFGWLEGAVGAEFADYFYPISVTEKELILHKCREIDPKGVVTIGSDLTNITVNYVARKLGLTSNPIDVERTTTNKYAMRKALEKGGISIPYCRLIPFIGDMKTDVVEKILDEISNAGFPLIVKPTDRSGSRAVLAVNNREELRNAIINAQKFSFEKCAIVESLLNGDEYSCESISFNGKHQVLQITKKYTTNEPRFVEVAHVQPSGISESMLSKIVTVIHKSLDALGVRNGAAHSEFRIDKEGAVHIIEIGARMGGDFIGSDLVPASTGYDFMAMVIDVAVGRNPNKTKIPSKRFSAVRFATNGEECLKLQQLIEKYPEEILRQYFEEEALWDSDAIDSSSRKGHVIFATDSRFTLAEFLFSLI